MMAGYWRHERSLLCAHTFIELTSFVDRGLFDNDDDNGHGSETM